MNIQSMCHKVENSRCCRPQRSCEGYVFTGVCLSTRGGVVCLIAYWDTTPNPQVDTPWEQTPPRSRAPEQTPPGSRHSPAADTPQSRHPPRDGHFCGWYASYWNAFLLFFCCFGLVSLIWDGNFFGFFLPSAYEVTEYL